MFSNVFLRIGYVYIRIYVVVFQCLCVHVRVCMYVCILYLAHVQYIKCITYTKNVCDDFKMLESVPTYKAISMQFTYCNYLNSILLSNAFSCIPLVEEQL